MYGWSMVARVTSFRRSHAGERKAIEPRIIPGAGAPGRRRRSVGGASAERRRGGQGGLVGHTSYRRSLITALE